ncbi:MAG TPA: Clp protease N-terminal domain-containing protein, partial [Actinomycetota bacterium]
MDLNKLTIKSQEALAAAQQLAGARNHQTIEPEHLLSSMLSQSGGVVLSLVQRLGTAPAVLRNRVEDALEAIPKVYAGRDPARIGPALSRVLDRAFEEASKLGDEYVSTEHLLLALVEQPGRMGKAFKELGITQEAVLGALQQVRGTQKVTSQNPEETYQALERFGRDLTDLARKGKLDPVIGRD